MILCTVTFQLPVFNCQSTEDLDFKYNCNLNTRCLESGFIENPDFFL